MLALTGSGEYLTRMEPVDRELIRRLGMPAKVVCLPTAAGTEGPERIDYWSRLGIEHFEGLRAAVEAVPVIDRTSAQDPELAERIAAANFVYLSGGRPAYLYDTLVDSRAWEAILSVVARGGILAGCSAGAMIMGEKIFGFPGWSPGFGLIPSAVIIPHFDEIPAYVVRPLGAVLRRRLAVIGIDGFTALLKDGGQYEVLGSGGVTVWDRKGKRRYTQGETPAWLPDSGEKAK